MNKTIKRDENHIYVNVNQYNSTIVDQTINIQKTFNEVVLPNPIDYEMSVLRFDLDGFNIPIMNVENYFVNGVAPTTILQIKFVYNTVEFIRPLVWASFSSVPNDYLYYDYNQIATIFNNTLNLLTTDVNTAFPATIPIAPRIQYDPLTTRFVLYADKAVFSDTLANPVQLWLSGILHDLFHSLPYTFYQEGTSSSFSFLRILIGQVLNPYSNTDNTKVISGVAHWGMIQEYQSLISLNSAKSIVLTSDLPIVEEYLSSIGNDFSGSNISTIQYPIVSDFILESPNGYEIFNKVVYVPSAEYRMLSLQGSKAISSIRFKAYWQDSNGNLNPLLISGKTRFNIKIMFRKKTWKQ
jgi:hypothetical protein